MVPLLCRNTILFGAPPDALQPDRSGDSAVAELELKTEPEKELVLEKEPVSEKDVEPEPESEPEPRPGRAGAPGAGVIYDRLYVIYGDCYRDL